MLRMPCIAALLACLALMTPARGEPPNEGLHFRNQVAACDMRFAGEWIAKCYEVPPRVPQEMLIAGYSYADTLVAMALMGQGASLNELLELRQRLRWDEIAKKVELDPQNLALPIRNLLSFSRNEPPAPVLHYLPDVYAGLDHDLTINAFSPTVPSVSIVKRFRLNHREVETIRSVLDDPFGVPDEWLLKPAGKGLVAGDWVLAGVLSHHKPFSMDHILAAHKGEQVSWSELCLAFGFKPDVLTQGPLSGIYPILTGYPPGTILCARRRHDYPAELALSFDIKRLVPDEEKALYPLLLRAYQVDPQERTMLDASNFEMPEKGMAIALTRLSRLDLGTILTRRQTESWTAIINRYRIDMRGQEALLSSIGIRERGPAPPVKPDPGY